MTGRSSLTFQRSERPGQAGPTPAPAALPYTLHGTGIDYYYWRPKRCPTIAILVSRTLLAARDVAWRGVAWRGALMQGLITIGAGLLLDWA